MGTKSKAYRKRFIITNRITGEVFGPACTEDLIIMMGYNFHMPSLKASKKKWHVEDVEPEQIWNESGYRTEAARQRYLTNRASGRIKNKTKANRSRYKNEQYYRKRYNLSLNQYQHLEKLQDYKCSICGCDDEHLDRKLAVDHCHETLNIRGLLCGRCNTTLGKVEDNVDLLHNMIKYLQKDVPILPEAVDENKIKPEDTKRYMCEVTTPDGVFTSYAHAAKYYGVHASTIRTWCLNESRTEFKFKKLFISQNEMLKRQEENNDSNN